MILRLIEALITARKIDFKKQAALWCQAYNIL